MNFAIEDRIKDVNSLMLKVDDFVYKGDKDSAIKCLMHAVLTLTTVVTDIYVTNSNCSVTPSSPIEDEDTIPLDLGI